MSVENQTVQVICKYYQTGCCKYEIYCHNEHITDWQVYQFAGTLPAENDTQKHVDILLKTTHIVHILTLEFDNVGDEVKIIKAEIKEIKLKYVETTQKLQNQVAKLSKNMGELMIKLLSMDANVYDDV